MLQVAALKENPVADHRELSRIGAVAIQVAHESRCLVAAERQGHGADSMMKPADSAPVAG